MFKCIITLVSKHIHVHLTNVSVIKLSVSATDLYVAFLQN